MENIHASSVGIIKKDIYIITNDINRKVYVGQTKNIEERFKAHCKPASAKENSLIDKAIQKYGKEHFTVKILESQVENYDEREKYWIKYYNSQTPFGYNILEGGNKPPTYCGDDHPNVKISDTDVIKLKNDLKNTQISLNELALKYNISKRQVLRINQGISRSKINEQYPIRTNPNINGKLTEEQVDEIIELLKYTYRFNGDIAKEYGVQVHTISDINSGKSHYRPNIQYPIRNWKSCGKIVFTYEQVTDIIDLLLYTTESISSIAKRYNVSREQISYINRGTSKKYYREGYTYPLRSF